jgi:hypothetical protein
MSCLRHGTAIRHAAIVPVPFRLRSDYIWTFFNSIHFIKTLRYEYKLQNHMTIINYKNYRAYQQHPGSMGSLAVNGPGLWAIDVDIGTGDNRPVDTS